MSRLFVCNLPKNSTEQKLRELFSQKGTVTDCSLKYRQDDGKFRKFAFVGFSCEEEAQAAQRYFDNTYINTSRIKVAMAIDMGNTKPRPWSRHTKAAEAEKAETAKAKKAEAAKMEKERKAAAKKKKAEEKEAALLGELHQDPEFKEYLAVYSSRKQTAWDNDAGLRKDNRTDQDDDNNNNDDDDDDEDDDNEDDRLKEGDAESDNDEKDSQNVKNKGAAEEGKKVSDLEFLKSKMGESALLSSDDEEENDDVNVVTAKTTEKIQKKKATQEEKKEDTKGPKQKFCIKMKGLKPTVKESSIREFFTPVKVKVRLPKNKNKLAIGIAFVECFSEKDLQAALARNKNFIGKHKVYLSRVVDKMPEENTTTAAVAPKPKPWELKAQNEEEEESIAESGRLFVRNLPYICTEEDLQALFSAYGPVAELELPVDPITKKVKGFAHVTFVFPENAVTARMELDYKEFKGRLMHILPGQERKDTYVSAEKSSYKKQKDMKTKASASRSHNWNSLFLSGDTVATAMAAKYNTDKGHVLGDSERGGGGGSLGVRLALEETNLVQETRQFLLDNGVALDSFSQASGEKSQRVFIAKDLPPGTDTAMLQEVFGQYGTLARIILPPHGISAIVEFQEPSEAKRAFSREAYRRFKDRPLYLQWAPVAVFGEEKTVDNEARTEEEGEEREESSMETGEEEEEEEEEEREKSSAVKKEKTVEEEEEEDEESDGESEPNSTLYVKNINFNTTEATLLEVFSKAGQVRRVTIAKKKDVKNPGQLLSMGYGFVEYKRAAGAQEALKTLQKEEVEGHQLQLKVSQRDILQHSTGRKQQTGQQKGATKICVRNIPFQSSRREINELFRVFGELKYVRVPKKASGKGIQGFAFVEFLTKQDAKRAFDALCHSTHLYGRRLVLEWANTAETVEDLQFKTKRKFQGGGPPRKLRKQDLMDTLNKE